MSVGFRYAKARTFAEQKPTFASSHNERSNPRETNSMTLTQNKILSRRTFLRGTGVAIALPWLECMSPMSGSVANAGGISAT